MENPSESIRDLVSKHKVKAKEKEEDDLKRKKKNMLLTSNEAKNAEEVKESEQDDANKTLMTTMTFEELGVCSELCESLKAMGYRHPTNI